MSIENVFPTLPKFVQNMISLSNWYNQIVWVYICFHTHLPITSMDNSMKMWWFSWYFYQTNSHIVTPKTMSNVFPTNQLISSREIITHQSNSQYFEHSPRMIQKLGYLFDSCILSWPKTLISMQMFPTLPFPTLPK